MRDAHGNVNLVDVWGKTDAAKEGVSVTRYDSLRLETV